MFALFGKKVRNGLPGAKDIPDPVGQHLVVNHTENLD
jgi:hypothetical protein